MLPASNLRPHHYGHLMARWREVCRRAGLRLRQLARADGLPLYWLRTRASKQSGGIYLSAGIHGDEAGATEGLVTWAEKNATRLADLPLLILPCLNPWGLRNNMRLDASGNDLNRAFHRDDLPQIAALKALLRPYSFAAALMLHEDYDGQGLYLYEIQRADPHWGEGLLHAAAGLLPIEPRARVDRYHSARGLIRRRFDRPRYTRMGYPEAIWLHLHHSERTFTVETPSEFALEQRVAAHVAVLDELVRRAGAMM
jgi:protein MpaA